MCPLCLSALGWIAAGGVSSAGIGALILARISGRRSAARQAQ
jgi:hypothetical protein